MNSNNDLKSVESGDWFRTLIARCEKNTNRSDLNDNVWSSDVALKKTDLLRNVFQTAFSLRGM